MRSNEGEERKHFVGSNIMMIALTRRRYRSDATRGYAVLGMLLVSGPIRVAVDRVPAYRSEQDMVRNTGRVQRTVPDHVDLVNATFLSRQETVAAGGHGDGSAAVTHREKCIVVESCPTTWPVRGGVSESVHFEYRDRIYCLGECVFRAFFVVEVRETNF